MYLLKTIVLLILLCPLTGYLSAQKSWKEITTVEEVCESYPEQMKTMLNHFNLNYKGMGKVKMAHEDGNLVKACQLLLAYYKNGNTASYLRQEQPSQSNATVALSDTILNNVFVVQNVRGEVPYGTDGHRDWYYKGPNNDREWAWLSNRHSQINSVLTSYFETGNPKYANYIDLFLRDFIIKSMPYPGVKSRTSVWRGLEVSFRAKVWSRIFYSLIDSGYLSPATQLLILSSLPDHANYNRYFHSGNNWLTMEISALATVAANFPEYKESKAWLDYSVETMLASMEDQIYPDGVQTELTSHYHNVSLSNFEQFKSICDNAEEPLPDSFNQTIEAMYSYIAHAVRPNGFRILNNDGDLGSDRDRILKGAKDFNHPDWEYIATNGSGGVKPSETPSYLFPWAGHLISRSGFDKDAHWSFFDMGPWGSGHQHNDKLHLSISAFGQDLLVDAGRFAYTGEVAQKFRPYAKSTAAHNGILIDHKGQQAGPKLAESPLPESNYKIATDYDYASSSFNRFDVAGEVEHIRSLLYVRGEFWVVVDKIITDRPRTIDAFWHWHPNCMVEQKQQIVKTKNKKGNLAIIPIGKQEFNLSSIEGQEQPQPQGWYSKEYNIFEPNIASKYSSKITGSTSFVWLLLPSKEETPKVKATILSEAESGIRVMVKLEENSWELNIPFMNSEAAELSKETLEK